MKKIASYSLLSVLAFRFQLVMYLSVSLHSTPKFIEGFCSLASHCTNATNCFGLCCIILSYVVSYCTVLYGVVLCCFMLYCDVPSITVLFRVAMCCIMFYSVVLRSIG